MKPILVMIVISILPIFFCHTIEAAAPAEPVNVATVTNSWAGTVKVSDIDNRLKECTVDKDARGLLAADLNENWSAGTYVTTQLIRYDIGKGKTSINTPGLGAGIAFRFYPDGWMADVDKDGKKDIRRISPKCRATTFSAKTLEESAKEGAIAFPLFSLSPTFFVSQAADADQLSVQPALVVGLLRDIINIGVGYNLTKPDAGRFFLLLGIGVGFKF